MRRNSSSMTLTDSSQSPISRLQSTTNLSSLESGMETSEVEWSKHEIKHESTNPILTSSNNQLNKQDQEDYDHQVAIQVQMQIQHEGLIFLIFSYICR